MREYGEPLKATILVFVPRSPFAKAIRLILSFVPPPITTAYPLPLLFEVFEVEASINAIPYVLVEPNPESAVVLLVLMLNVQVIKPVFELKIVLYGDEKEDIPVLAKIQPLALPVVPTSLVSSSCCGEIFLLAPQSAPLRVTLQTLAPIAPVVV